MTICYVTKTYDDAKALHGLLPPGCQEITVYPWDAQRQGAFQPTTFDTVIIAFRPVTEDQFAVVNSEWSAAAPNGAMRFSTMDEVTASLKKQFPRDKAVVDPVPAAAYNVYAHMTADSVPVADKDDTDTLPISSYTTKSAAEMKMITANKALEEKVLRQFDKIQQTGVDDPRWLALARTQVEQAFMCANRSIFKPKRIEGPL